MIFLLSTFQLHHRPQQNKQNSLQQISSGFIIPLVVELNDKRQWVNYEIYSSFWTILGVQAPRLFLMQKRRSVVYLRSFAHSQIRLILDTSRLLLSHFRLASMKFSSSIPTLALALYKQQLTEHLTQALQHARLQRLITSTICSKQ